MGLIKWIVRRIRRRREEKIKPYEVIERSEAEQRVSMGEMNRRIRRWKWRASPKPRKRDFKPKTAYEKKLWSEEEG